MLVIRQNLLHHFFGTYCSLLVCCSLLSTVSVKILETIRVKSNITLLTAVICPLFVIGLFATAKDLTLLTNPFNSTFNNKVILTIKSHFTSVDTGSGERPRVHSWFFVDRQDRHTDFSQKVYVRHFWVKGVP